MRYSHRPLITIRSAIVGAFLGGLLMSPAAFALESYGFVRVVEGYADLVHGASGESVEAIANYPLIVGDLIRVSQGGQLEAVLPDGSLLRLDGNTELKLARLARSGDTHDETTLLQLLQGKMQVVVQEDPTSDGFRIDTANATLYLQQQGSYRIFTDGDSWTDVVAREGRAEIYTEQNSVTLDTGVQAYVDGVGSPRIYTQYADARDDLERWGDRLLAEAEIPQQAGYVDPSLSYAAAPLNRHGRWLRVGGRTGWRPYVSTGWRPYHSGWWIHTPSGLTWVSTEPWGWVTSHYGVWDHHFGMGWIWFPGHLYTPAAVYWYFGPTHIGWIPGGYYSFFYGYPYYPYSSLLHPSWPFYGWGGGYPIYWDDWTFCRYRDFGYRDSHARLRTGADLSHRGKFKDEVPRGIVTNDTTGLTPELWNRPEQIANLLENRHRAVRAATAGSAELPDLNPWIARQRELPENVSRAVMPPRGESGLTAAQRPRGARPSRVSEPPGLSTARPSTATEAPRPPVRLPIRDLERPSATRPRTVKPQPGQVDRGRLRTAPVVGRTPVSLPPTRQWDPDAWRRNHLSRPQSSSRLRRDARGVTRDQPAARRVWEGVRDYQHQGRRGVSSSTPRRPSSRGVTARPPSSVRRPGATRPPGATSGMSRPVRPPSSSAGPVSGGSRGTSSSSGGSKPHRPPP